MNLFTTANYIQELNEDHCNGNEIKKRKLDNDEESNSNDIVENVLNFEKSNELVHVGKNIKLKKISKIFYFII